MLSYLDQCFQTVEDKMGILIKSLEKLDKANCWRVEKIKQFNGHYLP